MILPVSEWARYGIQVTRPDNTVSGSGQEKDALKDASKEKVVLDLHKGNEHRRTNGEDKYQSDGPLKIPAHKCVRIKTDEEIFLPPSVFGVVCCRYSISARGLWVANAKIDPNFVKGPLWVTVMNATNVTITIDRLEAFCSIYISELRGAVEGGGRTTSTIKARPEPANPIDIIKNCLRKYVQIPNLITAIIVAILTLSVKGCFEAKHSVNNNPIPGGATNLPQPTTRGSNLPDQNR